jgi:hypothetical protein
MDQAREGGAITIAALTTALQPGTDAAPSGAPPPAAAAGPATP